MPKERKKVNNKEIGNAGEDLACEVLRRQGYRILCRNYRCSYGEIDIIACREEEILFVEVKTRLSRGYGCGREAVNAAKRKRIRNAAAYFLSHSKVYYESAGFQVIEIHVEQINESSFD